MKTIGVIGGIGTIATVDFFTRMAEITDVSHERDHAHIIINNNPKVPGHGTTETATDDERGAFLAGTAKNLENAGADIVVLTCNTAHIYQRYIEEAINIPFHSIINATCDAVAKLFKSGEKIAVFASNNCLNAGLYSRGLESYGFEPMLPDELDRERLMECIYAVKGDTVTEETRTTMKEISQKMIDAGAQAIIAGCTEIPLILEAADLKVAYINSTEELAKACIEFSGSRLKQDI